MCDTVARIIIGHDECSAAHSDKIILILCVSIEITV